MTSARIQIVKLYIEDDFLQIEGVVSNDLFQATIDTYLNRDNLVIFGEKLQAFPRNLKDEVILEVGEDNEQSYSYLFLRAYLYDTVGHAALEVKIRKNGIPVIAAYTHFSIATEVASLNEFGRVLSEWANSAHTLLEYNLYSVFK
jgi:hypothetical protein